MVNCAKAESQPKKKKKDDDDDDDDDEMKPEPRAACRRRRCHTQASRPQGPRHPAKTPPSPLDVGKKKKKKSKQASKQTNNKHMDGGLGGSEA